MRLDSLLLENFRCFKRLEVTFHRQLTVFIAPNGAGKTTVLDAARVALWPYVKGFDLGSQTGKGASIGHDDVRRQLMADGNMEPQLPSAITATGPWSNEQPVKNWRQWRERIKAGTNTLGDSATKALTAYGKGQEHFARQDGVPNTLPLIAHLGTSRLWYEGRFTSVAEEVALNKSSYSRTSGYLNCLAYSSSFKTFTAWYGWVYRSYREEQVTALERGEPLSEVGRRFEAMVKVVKSSIDALVMAQTGWHSLEYRASEQQQLVMQHDRLGVMPVDMLSDGLRNAIAMVADLAFRAYKLNPHLGERAALETPGVALIDEVDMFLHPSWQQTILASLRSAFPEIQFIVTTHSPQVISSVPRECIRLLGTNEYGDIFASEPLSNTYGQPSNVALHRVMQVDPQPPIPELAKLKELTRLVDQGDYASQSVSALMAELVAALGDQHEQIQRLRRSIQRQRQLAGDGS